MALNQDRGTVTGLRSSGADSIQLRITYPDGSQKWSRDFALSEVSMIDWSDEANTPAGEDWTRNPAFLVTDVDGGQSRHCPKHKPEPC